MIHVRRLKKAQTHILCAPRPPSHPPTRRYLPPQMCLGPLRRVFLALATSITRVHLGSRGEGSVPSAKLAICRRLEINDSPPPPTPAIAPSPPARLPQTWWELVSFRCQQHPRVPPIVFFLPYFFSSSPHLLSFLSFLLLLLARPLPVTAECCLRETSAWSGFVSVERSRPSPTPNQPPPLRGSGQVERRCESSCLPTDCSGGGQLCRVQRLQVKKREDDGSCFTLCD